MHTISLGPDQLHNYEEAVKLEWLETNGLGGWASSSVLGLNTRRYHGLLVVATKPPLGRHVLVSKLEEAVIVDGNRIELGSNEYPGIIHPKGYLHLSAFSKEFFPTSEFQFGRGRIRKEIFCVHEVDATFVSYELLEGKEEITLELLPLLAARDCHALTRANEAINRQAKFSDGLLTHAVYSGLPTVFIHVPESSFRASPEYFYKFQYRIERERGFDSEEDLFTPGAFSVKLKPGQKIFVTLTTDQSVIGKGKALFAKEVKRRQALLINSPKGDAEFLVSNLLLAADQFLVSRAGKGSAILAGYHWFSEWGRDTFISLPGLCLATGRYDEAKEIFRAYVAFADQGMVPNLLPEHGEAPLYNTVDGTLWMFVAVKKYLDYTGDEKFVSKELWPTLKSIIDWHLKGTRYGIRVADDGLLEQGEAGVALTWMDARVNGQPVTARMGKAVEVNALWYNALEIMADFAKRFETKSSADKYLELSSMVKGSFTDKFWNEEFGTLYDVVGDGFKDSAIRPNQIFALSLPFALLSNEHALRVLASIQNKLYTPLGLRTLDPEHRHYRGRYRGGPMERDSSYHQGTVWSWLLGPYITALVRYKGNEGQKEALAVLHRFEHHLLEAGLGTVSEIFDAEPPHFPNGSIAQAWGVAEVLRAYFEDVGGSSN